MATAPGYADCAIQITLGGMPRPAYVTFGVDPTDTDPMLVAGAINTAAAAAGSLCSVLDNSATITSVRVSMGTDGSEDVVGWLSTNSPGTSSKTSLPPNCAVLVHKLTTRGGRRGRGRMFLPWCMTESDVDEAGLINSSVVTGLQTALGAFRANLSAGSNPMVLLHDPSKPSTADPPRPPTSMGAPNLVTTLVVDKLISTQRRRLGR